MMTIFYVVGNKAYLNITNRCPCSCTFCIRNNGEGAYGSDSLWLDREPTYDEIVDSIKKHNLNDYKEIIFCGYGEPLERLDMVMKVSEYIKSFADIPVRINTNGLSDLINNKPTAMLLSGKIDTMSISLNASCSEEYQKVSRPEYGDKAFNAILAFAEDCKKCIPRVIFSVVDVISKEEIEKCQKLSQQMGIQLRVRKYDS